MELFQSDNFIARVNDLLEEWHCPGIAIALVQDGQISSRGFGKACVDPEKPMTADTLFDIASSSKSLTAAAVALLVEDDERFPEVKWDAKMSDLLPEDFVMSEESYTKEITVEDILSHRTGLPSDTPRSVTRNLRNLQITKPIRTTEQYNNMMFTVATHLVETLTGQTFADFLRERFWQPLGMTSTHLGPEAAIAAGLQDRIITPYHWERTAKTLDTVKLQYIPEAQGAGSIFTSASDYILWVKAMMNQEGPVTEAVYKGLVTPRTICDPNEEPEDREPYTSPALYCAGLGTSYYRGYQRIAHTGGDPGVASYHFFLPQLKFGGVVLANVGFTGLVSCILAPELIDAAIGVPDAERPDWNAREHKDDDEYHAKSDNRWREALGIPAEGAVPESEPLVRSQDAYVGTYHNAGYHDLVVEIKDGKLFIDATDRTMGFWLTLEHFKDQEKFIGHEVQYYDGCKGKMAVKFRFEGDGSRTAAVGLDLEEDVGYFIWFDRK